jgi:hypothetical protein
VLTDKCERATLVGESRRSVNRQAARAGINLPLSYLGWGK